MVVKNIPYRPDLNGIEKFWTVCKRQYRLKTDWMKANGGSWDQYDLIEHILWSFPQDFVAKIAADGWRALFAAGPAPNLMGERLPYPGQAPLSQPPDFIPTTRSDFNGVPL